MKLISFVSFLLSSLALAGNVTPIGGAAVTASQMPALTGDVTSSAGAVATTVSKIQGTTVSGVTGTGNAVLSADPIFSGSIGFGNYHVEPKRGALGNCGTALTINLSTANVFTITLDSASACAWTMSNPQDAGAYVFVLTQNASGNGTVTWPAAFLFPSGAPTLTASNAAVDKITCVYSSAATKYYCEAGLNYH